MHNLCMSSLLRNDLLLDKFDIGILAALQQDGHATNQEIGERIHLSASQVSRRIQRLQSTGVIRRYVALLSPAMLGLGVRAVTYVSLLRHGGDEGRAFENEMLGFPEVLECYAVAGEADYIMQILAADLSALSDSVLRRLTRIPGVSSIRSNIVLQAIKTSTEIPLNHLAGQSAAPRTSMAL